ncbi:hypothetical protein AK830_g8934 [Neonectria ditissima]|uniref:Uncharacterized protein n=1 Tax=Neonectria ditissima TaxID=78410 RepID=A0A0N8H607_9HYPO|nr:hypothetical protein AK830_g8934 [Neonectria ditissima]
MASTTVLRGFRISIAAFDKFLVANNLYETFGVPPFYKDHPDKDPMSVLLCNKVTEAGGVADKNNFRVIIPLLEGGDRSTVAYVTYGWVPVFAHRQLRLDEGQDLPKSIPLGFEELRKEILSYSSDDIPMDDRIVDEGQMGLYVVNTYGIRGNYIPKESYEHAKASSRSKTSVSQVLTSKHLSLTVVVFTLVSPTLRPMRRRI